MSSKNKNTLVAGVRAVLQQFERELDDSLADKSDLYRNTIDDIKELFGPQMRGHAAPLEDKQFLNRIAGLNHIETKIWLLQTNASRRGTRLSIRALMATTHCPQQTCQDANRKVKDLIPQLPLEKGADLESFRDLLQFGFASLIVCNNHPWSSEAADEIRVQEILDIFLFTRKRETNGIPEVDSYRPMRLVRRGSGNELILISTEIIVFPFSEKDQVKQVHTSVKNSAGFQTQWDNLVEGKCFPHIEYNSFFPIEPLLRGPHWVSYMTEAKMNLPKPVEYYRQEVDSRSKGYVSDYKTTGALVVDEDKYARQKESPPSPIDLSGLYDQRMSGLTKLYRMTYEGDAPKRVAIAKPDATSKPEHEPRVIHFTPEYQKDGLKQPVIPPQLFPKRKSGGSPIEKFPNTKPNLDAPVPQFQEIGLLSAPASLAIPEQLERTGTQTAIVVVDNRHPITQALAHAIRMNRASPEQQTAWKADHVQATVESAKKFVGFHNVSAVRKALDITNGILSLALTIRTKGEYNATAWAEIIETTPLRDLIGEAIGHVRALDNDKHLFPDLLIEPTPRERLLTYATAICKHGWDGYPLFATDKKRLETEKLNDDLIRLLVEFILEKNPLAWARSVPGEIRPTSEETINTLVLHYCSLQPGERMPEDICISPVSLRRLRAKYNIAPPSRLESARARFREIQNVLPPPLRKHLTDPRNGFAMQLQSEAPITEIIASNPAK